jgi:adenine phosphoribosyltransferase
VLDLHPFIRDIPDFPVPGILFRDITPLLLEPRALEAVVEHFAHRFREAGIERIAAVESRGFIFGAPLALRLGCGFVPVRKVGKLPWRTVSREYSLEYGSNHLEIHEDAIEPGQRVLIIDDVLATGGTAAATLELVRHLGGVPLAVGFLLEIAALRGRERLSEVQVETILSL